MTMEESANFAQSVEESEKFGKKEGGWRTENQEKRVRHERRVAGRDRIDLLWPDAKDGKPQMQPRWAPGFGPNQQGAKQQARNQPQQQRQQQKQQPKPRYQPPNVTKLPSNNNKYGARPKVQPKPTPPPPNPVTPPTPAPLQANPPVQASGEEAIPPPVPAPPLTLEQALQEIERLQMVHQVGISANKLLVELLDRITTTVKAAGLIPEDTPKIQMVETLEANLRPCMEETELPPPPQEWLESVEEEEEGRCKHCEPQNCEPLRNVQEMATQVELQTVSIATQVVHQEENQVELMVAETQTEAAPAPAMAAAAATQTGVVPVIVPVKPPRKSRAPIAPMNIPALPLPLSNGGTNVMNSNARSGHATAGIEPAPVVAPPPADPAPAPVMAAAVEEPAVEEAAPPRHHLLRSLCMLTWELTLQDRMHQLQPLWKHAMLV